MSKICSDTAIDCLIIGGGAAGLMAAANLARLDVTYAIVEHTDRLGTKLLSTGNGKCNYTNLNMNKLCYRSDCMDKVMPVIQRFNEQAAIEFFKTLGVFMREKNGYVYPHSETASSLQNALRTYAESHAVHIYMNTTVEEIIDKTHDDICNVNYMKKNGKIDENIDGKKDGKIDRKKDGKIDEEISANIDEDIIKEISRKSSGFIVKIRGEDSSELSLDCKTIIIATGSKSAPKTGSDGSGYKLATALGHTLVKPLPALVALTCKEDCKVTAGVRNTSKVDIYIDNKFTASDIGEVQFTDYGLSGIPIFQVSRYASRGFDEKKNVKAYIDLVPDITYDELLDDYYARRELYANKTIIEFYEGIVNKKLCIYIAKHINISVNGMMPELSDDIIHRFLKCMKHCDYTISGTKGFDSSQVCQGGVDMSELDDNMQSLKQPGVWFAGEVVDVDGICGGYNLQWAWSSAYVVANDIYRILQS